MLKVKKVNANDDYTLLEYFNLVCPRFFVNERNE
jgi:hypothetical protein